MVLEYRQENTNCNQTEFPWNINLYTIVVMKYVTFYRLLPYLLKVHSGVTFQMFTYSPTMSSYSIKCFENSYKIFKSNTIFYSTKSIVVNHSKSARLPDVWLEFIH